MLSKKMKKISKNNNMKKNIMKIQSRKKLKNTMNKMKKNTININIMLKRI